MSNHDDVPDTATGNEAEAQPLVLSGETLAAVWAALEAHAGDIGDHDDDDDDDETEAMCMMPEALTALVESGMEFGEIDDDLAAMFEAMTEMVVANEAAIRGDAGADPPVVVLECAACQLHLCHRGVVVNLIATGDELYSTDLVTPHVVETGEPREAPHCSCVIRDVACGACAAAGTDTVVGYHVVAACAECLSDPDCNHHYYMLEAGAVRAAPRLGADGMQLLWSDLAAAADGDDEPRVFVDEAPDALACPICLDVVRVSSVLYPCC
ncbi:uncharacterized protein AMSG_04701 [Thecamonas trahens ATCC 50062]|uniref:Uncharacterized protein n=1 Tax=Thecamonas trahens ATCC 50062 TaxID=461836 RepID=A0A0L0DA34_THETB|nr:hypothetical protein AMSG_04701 [Thecamonas trahens ATCC 50062]KNC48956.1 hypothetical protein AMSG_04701 [Thecamonas trahens ATCC 50062]|eukprot:XP_013758373.1 hypothetical protein AMSG_04701 [Thecamonas trahens ATCC 50062]